ncbi:MAG TPA: histidinol dehydrogenase, partial [Sunxiuqinia sp.]|nr:histidinol dehydrogenase [Sunxiuqinia sp.]
MKRYFNPAKSEWPQILERPLFNAADLADRVKAILNDIKSNGGAAVRKYTEKFDGIRLQDLAVSEEELVSAGDLIDDALKTAIDTAAENISKFHAIQKPDLKKVETTPGVVCWQKAVAIEKVGLYVPGGSAPLFSTVLMLAIPAKIAGCKEILLCTPPNKEGKIHPAILYAAHVVGVTKVFKLGGVQAIGAMAYGADNVPKVNKIFGPGNQYVMAAKQLISISDVAIDMPAGPSEVAIMADETANAAFIASDLLSQAEHGPDSQVVLVTNSEKLVDEVENELATQLAQLSRKEIATKALEHSIAIVVNSEPKIIEMINEYAPEHLIISMKNYLDVAEKIVNAGS